MWSVTIFVVFKSVRFLGLIFFSSFFLSLWCQKFSSKDCGGQPSDSLEEKGQSLLSMYATCLVSVRALPSGLCALLASTRALSCGLMCTVFSASLQT